MPLAEVLVLFGALLLSTAVCADIPDPPIAKELLDVVLALELAPTRLVQAGDRDDDAEREANRSGGRSGPTLAAAGSSSTPQGRTFGVGLQLGYPSALTLKYMLSADQGIVAGLGGFSSFAYDVGALSLHVDYVYHPHVLTRGETFVVTWYVGAGGAVTLFDNPRQRAFLPGANYYYYPTHIWLSARVPIGINLAMDPVPFEIYLEAAPQVLVFPGLSFGLGAAIGARFYF